MSMPYRLGTRRSALAKTQSLLVAEALRRHHPQMVIECVYLDTAGDKNQTTPLWQMEGVGFFTREIDEKILDGSVDFAVHSLKDLGTERPANLVTAAILERDNPRDIIIFAPDVLDKIARGETLRVGTSSPRRMELLPEFLTRALPPQNGRHARIATAPIRGNVDTRLRKVVDTQEYDAVCLAYAGVARLYRNPAQQPAIAALLRGTRRMILPLTVCPGAPGQGALCVETRADRHDILDLFRPLHHVPTARAVGIERDLLKTHGGGCHQQFGVVALDHPRLPAPLVISEGKTTAGLDVSCMRIDTTTYPRPPSGTSLWDGHQWNTRIATMRPLAAHMPHSLAAAFVAHHRAVREEHVATLTSLPIWTAGVASWYALAAQGLWVEGCADSLGVETIRPMLADPFLQLPDPAHWGTFTHDQAGHSDSGTPEGHRIITYCLEYQPSAEVIDALAGAGALYWASSAQFAALRHYARADALHACGMGKTYAQIQAAGIKNPLVFPNAECWKNWCQHDKTEAITPVRQKPPKRSSKKSHAAG